MTKIRPLHDFIAIDKDPAETASDSGVLIIAKKPEDEVQTGTVISTGPGKEIDGKWDEMTVRAGDRVLFNKGTGQVFEIDKKKYLFLKQRDLMGILR
jgi:chaperonin GroES